MEKLMDIVTTDFWEHGGICDFNWDKNVPPVKDGVIFCPNEAVAEFFEWCENHPERKFILVSAYSDYGIMYQKEHHPNKDVNKRCALIRHDEIDKIKDKYVEFNITVAAENCIPTDKFCVKIDSFTIATFNKIPNNITRWYGANLNISEPQASWIPLGINFQGHGKDIVQSYYTENKNKLLYLNFTNFTLERVDLKQHYRQFKHAELTIRNDRLPIEDFYKELSEHMFVLCPFGNGLDSYRLYETLAVGSIPILQKCHWSKSIVGLPVLLVDNMFGVDYNSLINVKNQLLGNKFVLNSMMKKFWIDKINDERKCL